MEKPDKITLEELKENMNIFLSFPKVEELLKKDIQEKLTATMLAHTKNGSRPDVDVLSDYLEEDTENRLKIILAMCGGSFEKFKRVYENAFLEKNTFLKKNINDIQNDKSMRNIIAKLFCSPDASKIAKNIPPFIIRGFNLPKNWKNLLQDKSYLEAIISPTLQAKYATSMGDALEEKIENVAESIGVKYKKGPVEIVDNKEVDVAIPNCYKPKIIIMSSYQLTTSSLQSSKANEQAKMYEEINKYNRRRSRNKMKDIKMKDIVFVNVIDGGGWLARNRDLEHIWNNSDYCFSCSQLSHLKDVIQYYM